MPSPLVPPSFESSDEAPSRAGLETLALAVLDDDGAIVLGPGAAELADDLGADVDVVDLLDQLGASAEAGAVTTVPLPGFVLHAVGVGGATPDDLRRAGSALARATARVDGIASSVHRVAGDEGLTAFIAGAVLASFRYTLRTGEPDPAVGRIVLAGGADGAVVRRAEAVARAGWESRRLATVPSNVKSPAWLADEVVAMAEAAGVTTRVREVDELEREGFGGIVAVGRASVTPPRLVELAYTPPKARRAAHVVLVGKGITFDTGGLSIKPGEGMRNMKRDMTGAGVVAAVMATLRDVDAPVRVTGLLPIAENAIGGNALRPGDVVTHWGGRTTEVTNTDAEGRLVMADALQYAATTMRPDVLVDVATLTGAMRVALGVRTGGFFATSDALAERVCEASAASGERIWRMPLAEEYESLLQSSIADADNAPGKAGAITAALFLQHFTGGLPWVHLDLASVGDAERDDAEWTKGPTGFGARLLLHWLGSPEPLEGVR